MFTIKKDIAIDRNSTVQGSLKVRGPIFFKSIVRVK